MRRCLGVLSLVGLTVAALASGDGARPAAAQGNACRLAIKGDSPVARACAEGGVVKAKHTMRAMIKEGRAQGVRFQCDDCHSDDTAYEKLTPEAKDRFARLLAVTARR